MKMEQCGADEAPLHFHLILSAKSQTMRQIHFHKKGGAEINECVCPKVTDLRRRDKLGLRFYADAWKVEAAIMDVRETTSSSSDGDGDKTDDNYDACERINLKNIELMGGPPWGFRLGALTTAILPIFDKTDDDEEAEKGKVVGAVKIARVNPESKASSAGLRDGDLILSVNGEDVQNIHQQNSEAASSSQKQGQSPATEYHQKLMSQFQDNKIRLNILSRKGKTKTSKKESSPKKMENVEKTSKGSAVRFADESATKSEIIEDTHSKNKQVNNDNNKKKTTNSEINNSNKDTPSKSSIIKENGQDEIAKMQPESSSGGLLLCETSKSSAPPPLPATPPPSASTNSLFSNSLLITQEDLQQIKNKPQHPGFKVTPFVLPNGNSSVQEGEIDKERKNEDEPIPTIWSPTNMPPSPKLGKKFRPVNFSAGNTSPSPSFNGVSTSSPMTPNGTTTIQSPLSSKILSPPSEDHSLSESQSYSLGRYFSNSSSSATTSSNLPKYQSPTVTLLQRAREGKLPTGASYLNDTRPLTNALNHNEPVIISSSSSLQNQQNKSRGRQLPNELIDIPMTSKSALTEEKQKAWYKKMYDNLHVEKQRSDGRSAKCTYSAGKIATGPPAKSFWAKRTHANGTVSEPEDFDHPDEEEYDFNKFGKVLSPVTSVTPGAIRFNNPGRIEDYNPGGVRNNASSTSFTKRQRYYRAMQPDLKRHWALASPTKSSGYESDSNYIMRKRTETDSPGLRSPDEPPVPPPLSPAEQKQLYTKIQKGGEVPLQGLRKFVPGPGPASSFEDPSDGFRVLSPSQNIRYSESAVNIHYKLPVRIEEKEFVPEEELRRRQQIQMKRFYEEQRKIKYMREMQDMESRRHSDNFVPSQKSPIPLNRYEDEDLIDGLFDNTPNRPGSGGLWQRMTPDRDQIMTPTSTTTSRTGPPIAIAKALYNFTAQSPRELQLVKGDIVLIRRKIDANWYEGELKTTGKTRSSYFYPNSHSALGIFPCTYVQLLPDDPCSPKTFAKYSSANDPSKPGEDEGIARVLYNFRPTHSFELELAKGELVILSRRVDKNWYEGRKQKKPQLSGIFPVSYVDVVKDIGSFSSPQLSAAAKKPVGQPVAHSLSYGYGSDTDDFNLKKHHYKPNDFNLHDNDSDYGDVFSPNPNSPLQKRLPIDKNERNRKRMNQRLELITVDTRLNNDQPFRYRAIYNYKPMHTDELELRDGDIVEVLEQCDDGWFVGTSTRTGLFGTFPGNYVSRI